MGIELEELDDAEEVIIKCSTKDIIISNPKVTIVKSGGQNTYQIMGTETEQLKEAETSEEAEQTAGVDVNIPVEDIELVAAQASVSYEEAEAALKATGGNLAKAILNLKHK